MSKLFELLLAVNIYLAGILSEYMIGFIGYHSW